MKAAICVKSPFSHNALFKFIKESPLRLFIRHAHSVCGIVRWPCRTIHARASRFLARWASGSGSFCAEAKELCRESRETNGCVFRNPDRSQTERRRLL